MFRSPCPLPALILWCRALRHGLDVGLSPVRVFRQQAKSGPAVFRPVAERMADRLDDGDSISDALKPEAWRFPVLFVELIAVGEQAGRLPVIFQELEQHYEAVRDAQRKFISALVYPAMMYVGAIGVLTLLILVLGSMSGVNGKPIDALGLGLVGAGGAFLFLFYATGFTIFVLGTLFIVSRNPNAKAAAEAYGLKIPGLAPVVRAFALHRFSMAAHMTIEAGLKADRVLKSSLRATANKAYQAEGDRAAKLARKGKEIVETLSKLGPTLFPDAFVQAVAIGEESGRLAEVMLKEAEIYREESIRGMKVLARIVSGLVYAVIGILVIVCIFRVFNTAYMGQIQQGLDAADDHNKWLRGG
ncbi:type II secretion system F family protein [Limnoglobus roseus]|uniref:General secretion pathway protein GspF n=1 Tax=Limnoglobus roseus TaxID=2598579 RepID=A0A5C1AD89_9BACT|nr:type II secretion system F family protein [Limnoglobus roseus]QEL15732.1 general secretion pathway protein GspF [Limnoglobus roseus]